MLSGSNRRLTSVTLLLALLLLAPAAARPPVANRDAAETTGGQEITDLDVDPTGRFSVVVVSTEATSRLDPGSIIGGVPGTGTTAKKEIFVCDHGPIGQPRAGAGCRGVTNPANANGGVQQVDAMSYSGTGGLTPVYAVAGPGDAVGFWSQSSDAALFTKRDLGGAIVNASVAHDGTRIVVAVSPSGVAGGKVVVYDGSGTYKWEFNLTDSDGAAAKPTSLAFARERGTLVVGTTRGVLFLDPWGNKPRLADLSVHDTTSPVVKVALGSGGNALVVGTADGVFYFPLSAGRPSPGAVWNRNLPGLVDVALSLDGKRFAAAAGNRVHFYRALDTGLLAEQLADSHDAGARVADLAYDATGDLLVAVAGDSVLGFGPHKTAPLWSFKATEAARGGLDAPLRKVALSEAGDRLVVAGRSKFMAYTATASATAAFGSGPAPTVLPATPLQVSFTLSNTGSLPDNYTLVVRRPVGWGGANPENLALDPDASQVVNLTVEAPAGTAPGLYPLSVDVRSRAANAVLATAAINLSLPRAVVLSLETAEDTLLLEPNDREKTVPVTIRNGGNAEGLVNLSVTQAVSQGSSWPVRFSRDQVRVPAGGEADVDMIVAAPTDAPSGARNLLTIRAREGDMEATRAFTAYVDADFGAELAVSNDSLEFRPGETRTLTLTVRNTGNTEDTYNVTHELGTSLVAGDWKVTIPEDLKVTLAQGGSRTVSIAIRPAVAEPRDATLTLRAVSQRDPARSETSIDVLLLPRAAEPTPEEGDESFLPGPSPLVVLAALCAVGLALRRAGGRR